MSPLSVAAIAMPWLSRDKLHHLMHTSFLSPEMCLFSIHAVLKVCSSLDAVSRSQTVWLRVIGRDDDFSN